MISPDSILLRLAGHLAGLAVLACFANHLFKLRLFGDWDTPITAASVAMAVAVLVIKHKAFMKVAMKARADGLPPPENPVADKAWPFTNRWIGVAWMLIILGVPLAVWLSRGKPGGWSDILIQELIVILAVASFFWSARSMGKKKG